MGECIAGEHEERRRLRVQAQTAVFECPCTVYGIVVELPLQSKARGGEIVRRSRDKHFFGFLCLGLLPSLDRLPYAVSVVVLAHDGPAVLPMHRLQMEHSAERIQVLEMQEPPLPVRSVHDRALMGAVDVGGASLEDDLLLIRAVNILGTQCRLPAGLYSALRYTEIVVLPYLVELRALGYRTFIYGHAVIQQLLPVRRHLVQDDGACAMDAVTQICRPVFIPERAGILPFRDRLDAVQRGPGARRVFCRTHEKPLVRGTEIHPELPAVIAYGRSPGPTGIMPHLIPAGQVEAVVDLGY